MTSRGRIGYLLTAFLLCLAASSLSAQTHVLTDNGTHISTEENGLVLLVRENHFAPVVTARVYVRTGSMLEGEFLGAGISHLAEHLVSGGTTSRRTEAASEKLLDELGGNSNAATSIYWTVYHIDTTADRLGDALDLLADWTNNASITSREFKREKKVVTRELERGKDNIERVMHQLASRNIYRVHPLRHPIIGYLPQLEKITRRDVIRYVRSRYVPNNMVVGVVGDVNADDVRALVRKTFGKYERAALPDMVLPAEPRQVGFRPLIERRAGLNLTRARMDFRTVRLDDDDMYPLDILSFVLSQGQSSRLVRELRDKKKLVRSITTWSGTPHFCDGSFAVYAQMRPGTHDTVRAAVWEELKRVMDEPVSTQELKQAKTQKISEHVFSNQTVGNQCRDMVLSFLSTNDPDYGRLYVDRIQKVTAEDITRVARKYFRTANECFTVLEPETRTAGTPETARAESEKTDKAVRFQLGNGMTVLLKRNRSVPAVSLHAFFLGGLRAETADKSGLARLTSQMLVRGTQTRSAEQIARSFESMGGAIGAASGNNTGYVSAQVLADHTDEALEVLADVVRNPSFAQDEIDGLRQRTLLALAGQKDNIGAVAGRFFRESMYPESAYGFDPLGSPETVKALTRADLVKFHGRCVKPGGIVLAVYGDIEPEKMLACVRKHFGDWTGGRPSTAAPVVDAPVGSSVFGVKEMEKRHQSAVVHVGFRGMRITDVADIDAMTVLETVMSGYGYPGGWLHSELRGKGLVYEVHAYNATWLDTGFVAAYARCQADRVPEVTGIILKAFKRARQGKVTREELRVAKRLIITSKLLRGQTNGSQATEAAINNLYGLGFAFSDSLPERIKVVTLADLKRVANKYFHNPVVAVTTPAPDIAEQVKRVLAKE